MGVKSCTRKKVDFDSQSEDGKDTCIKTQKDISHTRRFNAGKKEDAEASHNKFIV